MSKFKVGDKVRCVRDSSKYLTKGSVYEIVSVWNRWYRVVTDNGLVDGYEEHTFELVGRNSVLTPEEVFEHLLKGAKLQYKQEASPKGWRDCSNPQFANILNRVWRIKPEPEIIELNGKKYREIVE